MTDIQKHTPKIIQCIREHLLTTQQSKQALIADLHAKLSALLPTSYGVASSDIISNKNQQVSQPIDILIYDKSKPAQPHVSNTIPLNQVLLSIIFCCDQHIETFDKALDTMSNVKALKAPLPKSLPTPALDLSTRNERIPKHVLPVGIIFLQQSSNETQSADTAKISEALVRRWYKRIAQQSAHLRPDYVFPLGTGLLYRNRLLDCQLPTRHDIGWLREPGHKRFIDCYVCNTPFFHKHFYYEQLCPRCGDQNYMKRTQQANVQGKVAIVTGARLKIGYAASLKLLRAGATVVATTRFPHNAAQRYAQEPDFASWSERLHIYGLDLRHLPSIEQFISTIRQSFKRIDILINNAAQTVRRPPAFYAHLLPLEMVEQSQLPDQLQPLLSLNQQATPTMINAAQMSPLGLLPMAQASEQPATRSASLSQVPVLPEDVTDDPEHFPPDQYDADGQQIDLRTENSWIMQLEDVSLTEMLEVQVVNSIAPTMLIQQLVPLMRGTEGQTAYIINVTALEGQFSGVKTGIHPHTNMAKAALNMLTLTTAAGYAQQNIFMNSVDPGWVSHQVPLAHQSDVVVPLDEVDAAARVCDPIFMGVEYNQHVSGKLWKDYHVVPW